MTRRAAILILLLALAPFCLGQQESPSSSAEPTATLSAEQSPAAAEASETPLPLPLPPTNSPKRGWFGRVIHPFSGGAPAPPQPVNPKLRGLVLELQVSPQIVKLSEVRQIEVKLTVTNKGKRVITMDFPNDQRIDIYLMNSAEIVLTKWSENHAIKEKPGTLLINPQEHVEYNEKISTRELTPDKVFIAEAFFPKYPELRARQKFLTAP
jgi:hypothetical protein